MRDMSGTFVSIVRCCVMGPMREAFLKGRLRFCLVKVWDCCRRLTANRCQRSTPNRRWETLDCQ